MSEATEVKPIKRRLQGRVVSSAMEQTIAVQIVRREKHPLYGKYVKKSKKFLAHDPSNDCGVGDLVTIEESRPISKRKTWVLISVDERAK